MFLVLSFSENQKQQSAAFGVEASNLLQDKNLIDSRDIERLDKEYSFIFLFAKKTYWRV